MTRKIIKAQCGVELQEDETGKLYMTLDGFHVFQSGVQPRFKDIVLRSFDNIVNIRLKDGYK